VIASGPVATLQLAELSRALGVAVSGIDLHSPLGAAASRDLRHAFQRHKLLLICGQELDDHEHLAVISYTYREAVG
jgi:alpha-ketoglutarate-dependent taurine dioxygenase